MKCHGFLISKFLEFITLTKGLPEAFGSLLSVILFILFERQKFIFHICCQKSPFPVIPLSFYKTTIFSTVTTSSHGEEKN